MSDHRTRRQKLEAMANQTASPHEAAVARRMLARLAPEPPRQHRRPAMSVPYQTWAFDSRTPFESWYSYSYSDGATHYPPGSRGEDPLEHPFEPPIWWDNWLKKRVREIYGMDGEEYDVFFAKVKRKR